MTDVAGTVVRLLAPMAPFLAEELWETLGNSGSVFRSGWPSFDAELAKEEEVVIVVQVNGKVRDRFTASSGAGKSDLEKRALESEAIRRALDGKSPRKVIVVAGKLVNVVI